MQRSTAPELGTRFVAALESGAHPVYVDRLIKAIANDTVVATVFGDGWPDASHRVLRSAIDIGESHSERRSPGAPIADNQLRRSRRSAGAPCRPISRGRALGTAHGTDRRRTYRGSRTATRAKLALNSNARGAHRSRSHASQRHIWRPPPKATPAPRPCERGYACRRVC